MPYMRCATSKYLNYIKFDPYAIAQTKADGLFSNIIITDSILFETRNGKFINQLDHLKSIINTTTYNNIVIHGELRVLEDDGSVMPRKKGNGILNKCIKGSCDSSILNKIFFTAWDIIPLDSFLKGYTDTPYNIRFINTKNFVKETNSSYINLIPYRLCESTEEVIKFYRETRAKGEEGIIVKNLDGIWKDSAAGSKDCIKLKHAFNCELKVIGWNYGGKTSKFNNTVGSLVCESSCGKLKVNVSGLTIQERELNWNELIKNNAIITVEAESVITSKNKSYYSLYLPSFVEIRYDKNEADSLNKIIESASESNL